jgi:RNA polymerase sigma-70 factor (ECF subfamily)
MDEQQLAAALKARDPAALQELVASCGHRLLRSATLLCGNEVDAGDLVQETFVQALASAHRFRGQSSLYTWLHAILLNLTRHYHRDRQRTAIDDDLARRDVPAPAEDFHVSDARDAADALAAALGGLSGPHREVVILRFYENMKIHEIAAHLGISTGTAKSRLHYAIAELRGRVPARLNLFEADGTKETEKR